EYRLKLAKGSGQAVGHARGKIRGVTDRIACAEIGLSRAQLVECCPCRFEPISGRGRPSWLQPAGRNWLGRTCQMAVQVGESLRCLQIRWRLNPQSIRNLPYDRVQLRGLCLERLQVLGELALQLRIELSPGVSVPWKLAIHRQ